MIKSENAVKTPNEILQEMREKEQKSDKRLKYFSWIFFFVGLELLSVLIIFDVYPMIKVIALDVYVLITVNCFHKLGLREGIKLAEKYHKMDNKQNEETIEYLRGKIVDLAQKQVEQEIQQCEK